MGHYWKGGWLHCNPSNSPKSNFNIPLICCQISLFFMCLKNEESIQFLHPSHTNGHIIPFDWSLVNQIQAQTTSLDKYVSEGPSQTKTDTCFPKLHSPVLALKTGLREEISLQTSSARLPETIPKNILTEQFIPDASADRQNSTLSPPSRWLAASFFAGAPVMSQLWLWSYHPSNQSSIKIFHYCNSAIDFPVS